MKLTLLNVLILFGILQGLIAGSNILFSKKRKVLKNRLFAGIVMAIALSLLPSFIGNSELVFSSPYLRFLPLDLSLFIFPLISIYVRSIVKNSGKLYKEDRNHFIIPVFFWLYHFLIWILTLARPESSADIISNFLYVEVYSAQFFIKLCMIAFYGLKVYQLLVYARNEMEDGAKQMQQFKWLVFTLILILSGFMLDFISIGIGKFYGYWKGSPLDNWLGVPFSILVKVYYAAVLYIMAFSVNRKFDSIRFLENKKESSNTQDYINEVVNAVENRRLYRDQNLTLEKLASATGISTSTISSILNKQMNTSYNDFINRYRIEEVKSRMCSEDIERFTLTALAEDAGFKSRTTFYRAFQKFTKQSPKDFMENNMSGAFQN